MLAHELRNPLAAISNAAQLAKRSNSPEHQDGCREVIESQVKNLSRMIDDLLDVSRITRGKIRLKTRDLNLLEIIRSAVDSVRSFVEERRHRLVLNLSSEPLKVHGDPTRLEQIFVNLLNNATKYTESGGLITLSARRVGTDAVIRFDDTGIGMPRELLERIFDLFTQGDRGVARSEGGLGIGLTLVKSLVEMHGGTITAESDGPGTGSRLTVRLPLAQISAENGVGGSLRESDSIQRAPRILVVDDDPDIADGMARLLRLNGHETRIAFDGPSAIEAARTQRPDLIFLDLGLPEMDGYQVARALRGEGFDSTVIVAVSGYGEEMAQNRSREAGFDHHLVKPIDFESLGALIGRLT
jgi:CheY-like chemotaxis protein